MVTKPCIYFLKLMYINTHVQINVHVHNVHAIHLLSADLLSMLETCDTLRIF